MEGEDIKKIEARIQELPKDVQAAIMSNDFEAQVAEIGQKNRLHVDQIGELGDEVLLVMLGFMPADGFAEHIQKNLHLYSEQAAAIETQVNDQIFLPIRESMKKFQEDQKKKNEPAPSAAPAINLSDMMLSQKTVSMPAQKPAPATPVVPTAPKIGPSYKTDPYREPTE